MARRVSRDDATEAAKEVGATVRRPHGPFSAEAHALADKIAARLRQEDEAEHRDLAERARLTNALATSCESPPREIMDLLRRQPEEKAETRRRVQEEESRRAGRAASARKNQQKGAEANKRAADEKITDAMRKDVRQWRSRAKPVGWGTIRRRLIKKHGRSPRIDIIKRIAAEPIPA